MPGLQHCRFPKRDFDRPAEHVQPPWVEQGFQLCRYSGIQRDRFSL